MCPASVFRSSPELLTHSLMVLSSEAVAMCLAEGCHATSETPCSDADLGQG